MLSTISLCVRATEDEPRFPTTCDGELAFAPALPAIRIHPSFRNYTWIRFRIDQVVLYGQPYLSERELLDLVSAMDDLEAGRGEWFRQRGLIATLLNAAEDNLTREFAAKAEEVVTKLEHNAQIVLANGDEEHFEWLAELIARVEHYRAGISIERGAWYWQHARYQADQILERDPELPAWVADRRPYTTLAAPGESGGDFHFMVLLDTLGSPLKRNRLRYALEHAYRRTETPPPDTRPMARLTNVNAALSFLSAAPQLNLGRSRTSLIGSAMINGRLTSVLITFNPHHHYFTVRALQPDRDAAPYYQMVIDVDGQLEFVDADPIPPALAERRLDLTHFAY